MMRVGVTHEYPEEFIEELVPLVDEMWTGGIDYSSDLARVREALSPVGRWHLRIHCPDPDGLYFAVFAAYRLRAKWAEADGSSVSVRPAE